MRFKKKEQGSLHYVDLFLFPAGTIVSSGPNCSEQGSGRWLPKPSDTLNKFILLSKPSVGFKNIPLLWYEMMDVSKIVGFILPDWIADIVPGKYPVHNQSGFVESNFKSKVLNVVSGFKMSVVTNDAGSIVGLTSVGNAIYMSGLKWLVMLAPLGIVFYMSFGINKMSASKAQTTFWVFAGLMGLSLSSILLVYTGMSVTRVFFICSATFGAMSIYGYTTKRDLTKLGSFLMMGLIGIIIASIVNIFMQSSMMYFVISILGVLIFVGLTAYDTQKIKNMYAASDTGEIMGKKAVMGALTLYLDFINLFIMLLRLFGQRR
jgi:FtsH-binding integral membrane protein